MAKILCSKSGILFQCEHMPAGLSSESYHHPLFSVPQKKLLNLTKEWAAQRLSATESYLLYLSLLNSTDLVIWRTPARFTDKTISIVASNMEHLIRIVGKINLITHPSFSLPQMSMTYDTGDLSTSFHWIQAWIAGYNDFVGDQRNLQRKEDIKRRLERRENSLQYLIKRENQNPIAMANNLADWAMAAGDFPDYLVTHPLSKKSVPISLLWQDVIRACARDDAIWRYPLGVLDKLLEHCEENIDAGSIYANNLFKLLRAGIQKHENFTGFGDIDLAGKTTSFKLLRESDSVEDANVMAIIAGAPDSEPVRSNYPTAFAYMKAKANWKLKQDWIKRSGGTSNE